jgi:hypothetical protein
MNTIIKSIIAFAFLINAVNSFDCNMFPIIKKLFNKDTCYSKYNKNYVSRSHAIRNRRTSKNHYKMTDANINLRNSTSVSKEIDDFSKYLGNTAPSSNN